MTSYSGAQAGEMLGHKVLFIEAGSGAKQTISLEIIKKVAKNIEIPLIVVTGIIDLQRIQNTYDSGADQVVIGTAFESDINFFNQNP